MRANGKRTGYARGGPVEPREEDTVYDSTAPDWAPEAYSAALRKVEMEGEVGYQYGGVVGPPPRAASGYEDMYARAGLPERAYLPSELRSNPSSTEAGTGSVVSPPRAYSGYEDMYARAGLPERAYLRPAQQPYPSPGARFHGGQSPAQVADIAEQKKEEDEYYQKKRRQRPVQISQPLLPQWPRGYQEGGEVDNELPVPLPRERPQRSLKEDVGFYDVPRSGKGPREPFRPASMTAERRATGGALAGAAGSVDPEQFHEAQQDWPESQNIEIRRRRMRGRSGYAEGGEVDAPQQQERSPLGQVLDYTRKQFGLDQIGQPRTGYQGGGEVTDDETIIPPTARATEGVVSPDVPVPEQPQTLADEIKEARERGRAALAERPLPKPPEPHTVVSPYKPPPPVNEPASISPEAGWGEVLGAAVKRPFEKAYKAYEAATGSGDPFDTTKRAFGEPAGPQEPRAPFDWVKKGIAGYLQGDRALPPEQMTQVIEAHPLGDHNVAVQRTFDDLKRKGDIDTASQLVQGLRQPYSNLLAYSQAAMDRGNSEAAMRFMEKAHDLLPNERKMSIRQGEGGNFVVTVAPDRAGGGPSSTYNLSPQQFHQLAHGPAMQFDHAADNMIEKNLQILSRGAPLPVPPTGTLAGPGGIPFPAPVPYPATGRREVPATPASPIAPTGTPEEQVRAITSHRVDEPAVPREYDAAYANEYNTRRQALMPNDVASQARAAEFERRGAPGYQAAAQREVVKANTADEARRATLPAPPEGMRGGYMPDRTIAPPGYYAHRTLAEPQRTEWAISESRHYDPKTGRMTGTSKSSTPHTTPADQVAIDENRRELAADTARFQQETLAPTRTTPAQKQQYVMDKVERQQAGMAERTGMRVDQRDRALEFTRQKAVDDYVQKSGNNDLKYIFDTVKTKLAHDQPLNQDELTVYQHLLDKAKSAGMPNVPRSVLERSSANATYGAGGTTPATGAGPKNYPGYLTVFNADGSVGYVKQ